MKDVELKDKTQKARRPKRQVDCIVRCLLCNAIIDTEKLYAEVENVGECHIECFYKKYEPLDNKHE